MVTGLKGKIVGGSAWIVVEKLASALFQSWVIVNVLNRLVPDETAVVAILAVLVSVFNSFVDSGFSQALIRKKTPTATDYSSVFWFNIAISVAVYALLVALARPAGMLLDMPDIVKFAPVFFLIVPFGALGIIQQTVLTREFDFRRLSIITFFATIGSGLMAVGLAFAGFGVWALVGQRVSQTVIRSLLLWAFGHWKPQPEFRMAPIREMFGYSSRLLGTDLLNNLYNSIPPLIIGYVHRGTLGSYDMARKVRDLPVTTAMNAVQSVTFPALARIADDGDKFARGVGKMVGSIVFLMFPIIAGLITVSGEMFEVFLAPQWQEAVPFFRILCLAGFATPLSVISTNILRSRTGGGAVLRSEMVKKLFATAILASTIPFGVMPVTCGVVAIAFTDATVSFFVARRHSDYGFGALFRDVLPVLALTVVMAGAVWGVGVIVSTFATSATQVASATPVTLKTASMVVLAVKIFTGVAVYLVGAALLRLAAFKEFVETTKKIVGKVRPVRK